MTDPNQIAAAGSGQGTGDNSNAVAMANLANQSIVNGQTPDQLLLEFCLDAGRDRFRRADREHGAKRLGDPVADAERCALRRQSER